MNAHTSAIIQGKDRPWMTQISGKIRQLTDLQATNKGRMVDSGGVHDGAECLLDG